MKLDIQFLLHIIKANKMLNSSCDLGYWGNPNEIGGSCRVCQCNDNIDVRDPRSCDPYTGACQICINNAAGPNCERCADWYFGDAVRRKNCRGKDFKQAKCLLVLLVIRNTTACTFLFSFSLYMQQAGNRKL